MGQMPISHIDHKLSMQVRCRTESNMPGSNHIYLFISWGSRLSVIICTKKLFEAKIHMSDTKFECGSINQSSKITLQIHSVG
jgi:hypothetical protein